MKQTFIAIAMLIAIGSTSPMMAQSHRHTPRASVQIDTQKKGNNATATIKIDAQDQGIDAFSDTTDVDTADVDTATSKYDEDEDDDFSVSTPMDELSSLSDMMRDAVIPIVAILVIFLVAPVLIIGLICYFLYKYRKQKIRLAELALEKGQPIPDGVINESKPKTSPRTKAEANIADQDSAAKGIKNAFLGIGLAILGIFIDANVIVGVGFLVTCMGAGQFATACFFKRQGMKQEKESEIKVEEPKETVSHDLTTL